MPRAVAEWIGKTPDSVIPDRVRVRLFLAAEGHCKECTRKIVGSWAADHVIALINGGENRESNLQILCDGCHKAKTNTDVAQKALTYRKRKSNLGLKKSKWKPLPGSKASGWKRKMDGTWVRR